MAKRYRKRGLDKPSEQQLAREAGVEAADIVVLNRVVCCYPDYERLLAAAADHARRLLVFSHVHASRRRGPGARARRRSQR